MDTLRWGIVSTGIIAQTFAKGVKYSRTGVVAAIASRDKTKAQAFAANYPKAEAHGTYQSLLDSPQVDAVYIGTPHPQHAEWVIRAARAGKHILCEKPLGINHAEVMTMLDAARENGVFLMEAFMYRCHPQTQLIKELIGGGAIGEVGQIEASFGFNAEVEPTHRLLNPDLAGGGILDVGCYPVSMARMIAAAALHQNSAEPESLTGHGRIGTSGVDEWATALLSFSNGLSAQVATGVHLALKNEVTVYGTEGQLHIPAPWHVSGTQGGPWRLEITRARDSKTIEHTESQGIYSLEVDEVARCVFQGQKESAAMPWVDSLGNALALDTWRKDLGLVYPAETERGFSRCTLAGQPLRAPDTPAARTGHITGIETPVSRLVIGCDNPPNLSHMSAMLDTYFELGGNTFDNAYVYGNGLSETLLGQWLSIRGVRKDCVLIGKGAHTPHNFPQFISPQLSKSLDRLRTDQVDVYFLHRDNLDVPVGEFVDALNDELDQGRIRAFGGSNWTLQRLQAANDYALANNKRGFSVLSNNFSLAHMNTPVWPGVEACSSEEFRRYLQQQQITLMPWSSQARGFFTPWGSRILSQDPGQKRITAGTFTDPDGDELLRVWASPENIERRRRAEQLADTYDVELINIALAYVFSQPFPAFPLIGPRNITELRSCWAALSIELSPAEVAWLDLRNSKIDER